MNPTDQQIDCVAAVQNNNLIKIDAVAGSGKTSTLVMISQIHTVPSLYCAFNKVTATEASTKFDNHVTCRTTHSMAYGIFGIPLLNKLTRPTGNYVNVAGTGGEIGRYYKMIAGTLTKAQLGLFVKNTVAAFEQSADDVIIEDHVDSYSIVKAIQRLSGRDNLNAVEQKLLLTTTQLVLSTARQLWKARIDIKSNVLATHDTYLKLYQLSKPVLGFDIVYLDEAADTTPCVLDIVMRQNATSKVILVGDDRQAIYQWRGAVNAMSTIEGLTLPLSQSFRYGKEIADIAMAVLQNSTTVIGNDKIESRAGKNTIDTTKPYTRLFRTNSHLLSEAVAALSRNEKISIEIDTKDFIKLLTSAMALNANQAKDVKHERIMPFANWNDMVAEGEYDRELARLCKLIKDGKAQHIINVLTNYRPAANPHVILTTAHKSKGREWKQVRLEEDFPTHLKGNAKDKNIEWVGLSEAEQNILYVAVTRAIDRLEVNSSVQEALDYQKGKYRDKAQVVWTDDPKITDDVLRASIAQWDEDEYQAAQRKWLEG